MSTAVASELDWQRGAACAGARRDLFFPNEDELVNPEALKICRRCPIKEDCLEWALTHEERGIWGGLTEEQRIAITRKRHRVKCPDCRSTNVVEEDHSAVCISCGLSWMI